MPARILTGAMCVQRVDDSLNSAIHITYRISLRSSSMPEPRDPLLKVLTYLYIFSEITTEKQEFCKILRRTTGYLQVSCQVGRRGNRGMFTVGLGVLQLCNDPSAGSPTETLLRLLLP